MDIDVSTLMNPTKVWSRQEVLSPHRPVPRAAGIYACYFREIPPFISIPGCHIYNDLTLLYVDISPSAPFQNGKPPSSQTLYDRIRYHYNGNAEGSTLRLTLGCLLGEQLNIQLRRVGSGKRMTFGEGEDRLDDWMGKNTFVTWLFIDQPWILEEKLISELFLPLIIDKNKHNPNHDLVSGARRKAKAFAREFPILIGNY